MEHLIQRVEQLEKEVFGIAQGNYQLETINDSEIDSCKWNLKDNIPVSACRSEMCIPQWLSTRTTLISCCPYCGRSIEVIE